ncbi:MAG: carboxy terminal-processing peptidase [Verrucomicrobiota bacterium]
MKPFSILLFLNLAFVISAAELPAKSAADIRTEKNIAVVTSRLLENLHYSQKPFDNEVSSKLFDRYLDSLDGLHLQLLQSDLAEFEKYRIELDDLTGKAGDTTPAHKIFARLLERGEQRVAYVNDLLKTEKFEFTGEDRYTPDRRKLSRPKDIEEAHQLWRQHLRSEFLQEKLSITESNQLHAALSPTNRSGDIKLKTAINTNLTNLSKTNLAAAEKKSTNVLTQREEIVKRLTKRYANLQRRYKELSEDDVLEIYLNALARVYDPHSDYMGRSHFENFNISMKLSLVGIGALLEAEDGYCKIKELMPGPAQLSKKLKPGDRIVEVAQKNQEPVNVVDMPGGLNKVVELIRGAKGTEVKLTIWPADATDPSIRKTITLVRDVIKLEDQAAKAKVIEIPNQNEVVRLGIIDLPSFYADTEANNKTNSRSTTEDIAKLLKKLNEEKVSGIILDLRLNGGGLLDEAVSLTGLFITNGPVVQVKDHTGEISALSDPDDTISYKGPLIILTSKFSASASEILAGALQDYRRALIVGDSSTYGKGTVQRLLKLDPYFKENRLTYSYDPGALKPTTAKFYRAGGDSTQLRGVIPDIRLPDVIDYMEVGEASMENPLPFDNVPSSSFRKWNSVKPFLPELKRRSEHRVETDKDFSYIREDIEQFKKNLADKSISLNELKRREENKELTVRKDARIKERKARKPTTEKVFEVTLKNADQPGLQLFVPKTNEVASARSDDVEIDEDASPDEKLPAVDTMLEESKRILLDYISLMAKEDHALSKAQ